MFQGFNHNVDLTWGLIPRNENDQDSIRMEQGRIEQRKIANFMVKSRGKRHTK